jgi:hypothetical protein
MLELSDIQSSQVELEDYYTHLRAQHITPAWIGGRHQRRAAQRGRAVPRADRGDALALQHEPLPLVSP